MSNSIKSEYAPLLNRLVSMRHAPYYAAAREVLSSAEEAIVKLEAQLSRAEQERDAAMREQSQAARDVLAERHRQVSEEGWTTQHDDEHGAGEMAMAAACYASHSANFRNAEGRDYQIKAMHPYWPWVEKWWKPKNPRRDLVRAAALILAEIERIDRAAIAAEGREG